MFRKSLVGVLILLYSTSVIGIPLHFHYCKGELRHVTLLVKHVCCAEVAEQEKQSCCKSRPTHCGNTMGDCCDDATEWIQDDMPVICTKAGYKILFPCSDAESVEHFEPVLVGHIAAPPAGLPDNYSGGPPLYVLQCALIFYG